jgi:hypothetical protein
MLLNLLPINVHIAHSCMQLFIGLDKSAAPMGSVFCTFAVVWSW